MAQATPTSVPQNIPWADIHDLMRRVDILERRRAGGSGGGGGFILGEIRMYTGLVAPTGWELCRGQVLASNVYPALFTLLGNRYGGNGTTTYALPSLAGRYPIGLYPSGPWASTFAYGGSQDSTLVSHQHAGGTHRHGLETHTHTMKNHTHGLGGHVHHINHYHGAGAYATNVGVYYYNGGAWSWGVGHDNGGNQIAVNQSTVGIVGTSEWLNSAGSGGVGGPGNGDGNSWGPSGGSDGPSDNTTDYPGGWGGGVDAYSGDTDFRGVAATNGNLPPWTVVNFIIRVI